MSQTEVASTQPGPQEYDAEVLRNFDAARCLQDRVVEVIKAIRAEIPEAQAPMLNIRSAAACEFPCSRLDLDVLISEQLTAKKCH